METIAVLNQKGGVGKTTTAIALGHGLALRGLSVLLVDLDAQGNVADALGLEKSDGLYRLLIGTNGTRPVRASGRKGLSVILGDKTTVEAKQILAGRSFREYALQEALAEVAAGYDVVVLDAAPGVDVLQVGALVAATSFLIPVGLSHLALVGAGDALASAGALAKVQAKGARFLGVLPTMWERTTKESHEQLQALSEQYGRYVWPPVPLDVKAREAPAYGRTLWEYAPTCRALDGVIIGGRQIGGYRAVLERVMAEVLDG